MLRSFQNKIQEINYKVSKNIIFLIQHSTNIHWANYVKGTSPGTVWDSKDVYDILFSHKGLTNWKGKKKWGQALKTGTLKLTKVSSKQGSSN